jgi:hypothetical protein
MAFSSEYALENNNTDPQHSKSRPRPRNPKLESSLESSRKASRNKPTNPTARTTVRNEEKVARKQQQRGAQPSPHETDAETTSSTTKTLMRCADVRLFLVPSSASWVVIGTPNGCRSLRKPQTNCAMKEGSSNRIVFRCKHRFVPRATHTYIHPQKQSSNPLRSLFLSIYPCFG